MEIPYHGSTPGSEGQRSSLRGSSASPSTIHKVASVSPTEASPKKSSIRSAVSNVLHRNRPGASARQSYEDMKWAISRKSSSDGSKSREGRSKRSASGKDAQDLRVTVV